MLLLNAIHCCCWSSRYRQTAGIFNPVWVRTEGRSMEISMMGVFTAEIPQLLQTRYGTRWDRRSEEKPAGSYQLWRANIFSDLVPASLI